MLNIKINNLDVVLRNVKDIEAKVQGQLQKELNSFGLNTVADAKRFVPVDEGTLRNSISYKKEKLKVTITVGVNYAAYLEFGTRRFAAAYVATLPQDWQTFAATFKGKGGGNMEEFLKRLTDWVHRKGLAGTYSVKTHNRTGKKANRNNEDYNVAYQIALFILRNGIRPHPFLYPAYQKNRIELIANIKAALR